MASKLATSAVAGALQDTYADDDTLNRVRAVLAEGELLPINLVIARVAEAVLSAKRDQRPIHRGLNERRALTARHGSALDDHVDMVADFLARRPDVTVSDPHAAAFVLVHAIEGIIVAV